MSLLLVTALRLSPPLSPADRAKHENASPVALQEQMFCSCLCADEVDASICIPSRDDVVGGPILQAQNPRVKARRVPSARSVVLPQDEIHDVGLAVEQAEQAHPKQDARVAEALSAVARTRGHVAGRAHGGSILRRRPGARGRVLPLRYVAGAPDPHSTSLSLSLSLIFPLSLLSLPPPFPRFLEVSRTWGKRERKREAGT
jgi:hypothetical protein